MVLFLLSSTQKEAKSPEVSGTAVSLPVASASTSAAPTLTTVAVTSPAPLPPANTDQKAELLQVLSYHGDEVRTDAPKLRWFGLFKNSKGWYLKQTNLKTAREYDPIVDDENGKKTGIAVTVSNPDTSLLLVSGLEYLRERQVPAFNLGKNQINPGEEVTFNYKGNTYRLWATGKQEKVDPAFDELTVSDYKLYLSTTRNGQEVKQLLVEIPAFDATMVQVLFAGDIDGDGFPDLFLDTADHYNVSNIALYLSAPAKKGQLVKLVGTHTSVGC